MKNLTQDENGGALLARRSFLRYAGAASASVALVAAGCTKDHTVRSNFDFGTGDTAILNYAYALEQLEAAFYTQVIASPYGGMTDLEKSYLTDIRDHEIAHREFFSSVLKSDGISALEVDFSSINFGDRNSVLTTARTFEDLGVSAYNGAGFLIQSADYLTFAGKIVSVEARHAALIRDLITPGSFVADDVVSPTTGMDTSRSPGQVLALAGKFIKSPISTTGLPNY